MTLADAKKQVNEMLKNCVADYNNNATQIFLHVLNITKHQFILLKEISEKQFKVVLKLAKKRAGGVPLQHLIGYVDFCDNKINVNKHVLIPRNETEQLCELVAKESANKNVLDLCTGSGCIGLGIKKMANCNVTLVDISAKALKVAKQNAKQNNLDVTIIKSNLFKNVKQKFDVVVSNPPYLTDVDMQSLQTEVKYEPALALFGGNDGLSFYKQIIDDLPNYLNKNGVVFFEYGLGQAQSIKKLLSKNFECITILKDYYNKNRFVKAKLKDVTC